MPDTKQNNSKRFPLRLSAAQSIAVGLIFTAVEFAFMFIFIFKDSVAAMTLWILAEFLHNALFKHEKTDELAEKREYTAVKAVLLTVVLLLVVLGVIGRDLEITLNPQLWPKICFIAGAAIILAVRLIELGIEIYHAYQLKKMDTDDEDETGDDADA